MSSRAWREKERGGEQVGEEMGEEGPGEAEITRA